MNVTGLHYTDSSHLVSTNSSDNQSDLWIKANGSGEIPNGSYQHYDPSSGYMYPEDYHPLNDDLMNQRNRDPYSKLINLFEYHRVCTDPEIPRISLITNFN